MYWSASGNIVQSLTYKNNVIQGEQLTYYDVNRSFLHIRSRIPYKDGKKHGIASYYSESGLLIKEEIYGLDILLATYKCTPFATQQCDFTDFAHCTICWKEQ